jgi:hypothetical protein
MRNAFHSLTHGWGATVQPGVPGMQLTVKNLQSAFDPGRAHNHVQCPVICSWRAGDLRDTPRATIIRVSLPTLPANTIFRFIVGDFEAAWNALVARRGRHSGGGNFMFALLSMILLEFASRICAKDRTNTKLKSKLQAAFQCHHSGVQAS